MATSVTANAPATATAAARPGAFKPSSSSSSSSSLRSCEALRGTPLVACPQTLRSAGMMPSRKPQSAEVRGGCRLVNSMGESVSNLSTRGGRRAGRQHASAVASPSDCVTVPMVDISGTVVLETKNILDFQSPIAELEDALAEFEGHRVEVRLVSVDLNPVTKEPKVSEASPIRAFEREDGKIAAGEAEYPITFTVPADFGEPGAILVTNNLPEEFFLSSLSLQLPKVKAWQPVPLSKNRTGSVSMPGQPEGTGANVIHFPAGSVIYNANKFDSRNRVFFSNKTCLPSRTPPGLLHLRQAELVAKRGDGNGERVFGERIYDYAVYNDLSKPNTDPSTDRPVLGGSSERPYPRRCRTGRPWATSAPQLEINVGPFQVFYIPRDEAFSRVTTSSLLADALKATLHSIVPAIETKFDKSDDFESFASIMDLYAKGVDFKGILPEEPQGDDTKSSVLDDPYAFFQQFLNSGGEDKSLAKYPLPQVVQVSEAAWLTDEEFGHQALAGLNPVMIELVKEFPPTSSLDPAVYGPATALTDDHLLPYLEGLTVAQAMEAKRLFMIDYHDLVLPFIELQNTQGNGQGYAPRSILFLTRHGTLKVIAIELALPAYNGNKASIRAFTAAPIITDLSLNPATQDKIVEARVWQLVKLHANTVDFGVQELGSHWLDTHATMEPVIIAANRQLSPMHPVFVLLFPTFKNTMNINAAARQSLINADGIIEKTFTPGKFCMELSSALYRTRWRFDRLALPEDLIARGMAERAADGRLKLVMEDYPFAKDALQIWDAILNWTTDYIALAYPDDAAVLADAELQAWWTEYVQVGNGDLKDADWWPKLDSRQSLAHTLATIAWTAGPQHAAINFGQYAYAGYPPNRPSQTRRLVPEKGSSEYKALATDPSGGILGTMTTERGALSVMTTIEVLSTHAEDEEYLGRLQSNIWTSDPAVLAAYNRFARAMEQVATDIEARNQDPALKNRRGLAQVPYTLLYPWSSDGLTGQGVPYSTSV